MPIPPRPATEFSSTRQADAAGSIVADPASRPAEIAADALVVFLAEGMLGSGPAAAIDRATSGLLGRLAAAGELTGKRYECVPMLAAAGLAAGQLLVVGLGKRLQQRRQILPSPVQEVFWRRQGVIEVEGRRHP